MVPGNPDHLGCEELRIAIERVKPKLHIFGHIHDPGGTIHKEGGTTFINASLLDEQYQLVRQPIVIDI
jgi:Icc-related predicted phosphoesterase